MKKTVIFLVGLIPFVHACTSEEMYLESEVINTESPVNVKLQRAVDIANEIANTLDESSSRAISRYASYDIEAITDVSSRSGMEDTLIYAVNYANDNGYALISAKEGSQEVLAVIDNGHFDIAETSSNPGFKMFMDQAKAYVQENPGESPIVSRSTIPSTLTRVKYVTDSLENVNQNPKLQVAWGQVYPEGIYCPNKISGCAPLAMAMIFSYFEQPTQINLTYTGSSKLVETLNWESMKKHSGRYTYENSCYGCPSSFTEVHNSIGRLCREIGNIANSDYTSPTATSTNKSTYVSTLKYFLPDDYYVGGLSTYSWSGVIAAIKWGLAMMRGTVRDEDGNDAGGHAWVADGCKSYRVVHRTYTCENGSTIWKLLEEVEESRLRLIHYNWGLNGMSNGYFNEYIFSFVPNTPDSAYQGTISGKGTTAMQFIAVRDNTPILPGGIILVP